MRCYATTGPRRCPNAWPAWHVIWEKIAGGKVHHSLLCDRCFHLLRFQRPYLTAHPRGYACAPDDCPEFTAWSHEEHRCLFTEDDVDLPIVLQAMRVLDDAARTP